MDQLELRHRNGNIVLGDMKKTAGIDNRVGNRLVRRDDYVIDISDPLVQVVVDWRAENLALGTPTGRDVRSSAASTPTSVEPATCA